MVAYDHRDHLALGRVVLISDGVLGRWIIVKNRFPYIYREIYRDEMSGQQTDE